jgi:hypothetical protein
MQPFSVGGSLKMTTDLDFATFLQAPEHHSRRRWSAIRSLGGAIQGISGN